MATIEKQLQDLKEFIETYWDLRQPPTSGSDRHPLKLPVEFFDDNGDLKRDHYWDVFERIRQFTGPSETGASTSRSFTDARNFWESILRENLKSQSN